MSLSPGLPACCAKVWASPEKKSRRSLFHKKKLFVSQLPPGPPRCRPKCFCFFLPRSPRAGLSFRSENPPGRLLPPPTAPPQPLRHPQKNTCSFPPRAACLFRFREGARGAQLRFCGVLCQNVVFGAGRKRPAWAFNVCDRRHLRGWCFFDLVIIGARSPLQHERVQD